MRAAGALLLLWGLGCAGARPAPEPLALPGDTVEAVRGDLDLVGKNDEELFALGQAARQSGDLRRAASAFGRIADLFPSSRHRPAALRAAGQAHLDRGEWREALRRLTEHARAASGAEADESIFLAAACRVELREPAEARALLEGLLARTDLPAPSRVRALTERGVLQVQAGETAAAERSLGEALEALERAEAAERLGDEPPAKAHYWMGEALRQRFLATPLDLGLPEEALLAALEARSLLLLEAQGHYLGAARRGSPGFGVAGLSRVGELYEALHAELAAAPPPAGATPEEAAAWREALDEALAVLVHKAVAAHDEAVRAARARGLEAGYVLEAEQALERLKARLLAAPAR